MLDGLLGRGFYSKCKSYIKLTKTRIDAIRRKRSAVVNFLKRDMADLLRNGLDINAYGRADVLLAELNLSSSYDFVEYAGDFILKHLSLMQKQRECPEECREAVSSLMFAAARVADMPELRELRDIFQERYENSLEYFANREFVDKLSSKPSTIEKKLQLMCDVAAEFSINWDSGAFEKTMSNPLPSPILKDHQPKKFGSFHVTSDRNKSPDHLHKIDRRSVSCKESREITNDGHRSHTEREVTVLRKNEPDPLFGKHEPTENGFKLVNGKEETLNTVRVGSSSRGGLDYFNGEYRNPRKDVQDTLPREKTELPSRHSRRRAKSEHRDNNPIEGDDRAIRESRDPLPHEKTESTPRRARSKTRSDDKSMRRAEEEADGSKPNYQVLPPPYVKLKDSPSTHARRNIQNEADRPEFAREVIGPTKATSNGHHHDDITGEPIMPRPRSMRRRRSKSSSSHDDLGSFDNEVAAVKRKPSGRKREDSRRGLEILFDRSQRDKEERIIDKLLMHYSKKPSSYEEGKVRKKSKDHPHDRHEKSETALPPLPPRSNSLPHEQTGPSEPTKVYNRAISLQPDRAGHVHPKLPDYDELAARFTALKGR